MKHVTRLRAGSISAAVVTVLMLSAFAGSARAWSGDAAEGPGEMFSAGAEMALTGPQAGGETYAGPGNNNPVPGIHDSGRGGITFVNDPCLDPPAGTPASIVGTVQSETELATYGSKYIVVGYNQSRGFYNNTQGLSGFAYSTDGGNTFIDGGGLPPRVPDGSPAGSPDHYYGDPVVVVDKSPRTFTQDSNGAPLPLGVSQPAGTFYYASIYMDSAGFFTISVNRGHFAVAPPQTPESRSNTRCLNNPTQQGVADTSKLPSERIVWEPPVDAVGPAELGPDQADFLDKEWLYVDQATGELYLTYTRFVNGDGSGGAPIEMVRSLDGGRTWTPPTVIVSNPVTSDFFDQATQPIVVHQGGTARVVVTWMSDTFESAISSTRTNEQIQEAYSNDDGATFGAPVIVADVRPQGEPPGYNRGRNTILNAPYITADPNNGNLYIAYFDGKTSLPLPGTVTGSRSGDILVSRSTDGGTTWNLPVKANDDDGLTSHVFPSIQVDKHSNVYVSWLDRRNDPAANVLTDTWATISRNAGQTFSANKRQTDVATPWYVRRDAQPNFGDYNSSDLLNDNQFVITWADGRFQPPYCFNPATCPLNFQRTATPDTVFSIAQGLGNNP